MNEPGHGRVRSNQRSIAAAYQRRVDTKASIERDEAGGHAARRPHQCPDASSSVRCFVSGAHAIDTIIPTSSTPANANIVA